MTETATERLVEMLKRHEGYRDRLYRCTAGKLTIGYGHNIEDKGISNNVAEMMLKEDIHDAMRDLFAVFPNNHEYPDNVRIALIDMVFNIGLPRFKKFQKMIAAVNARDWNRAADEMKNSEWYKEVKSRGKELEELLRSATEAV